MLTFCVLLEFHAADGRYPHDTNQGMLWNAGITWLFSGIGNRPQATGVYCYLKRSCDNDFLLLGKERRGYLNVKVHDNAATEGMLSKIEWQ